MYGAQNTCLNACRTLRNKCTCTRACTPMQWCRKRFAMETIANLSWVLCEHRAGCRLPPALLLFRRNQSPDAARSRNPSRSTLAHYTIAAAVSHTHHPIIRVGVGLIQFVYGSHLNLGHGAHPTKNSILAIFRASLQTTRWHNSYMIEWFISRFWKYSQGSDPFNSTPSTLCGCDRV